MGQTRVNARGKAKGKDKMKSSFNHPAFVSRMLLAAGYNEANILRAVKGSLGAATPVGEAEVKRGNIRDAKGSKGAEYTFGETENQKYIGKQDAPARWAKYCDALAAFAKKQGEPSGELTPAILPESHLIWLSTFLPKPEVVQLTPSEAATPVAATPEVKPKGNGKRNGSMHVADAVQPA
jgi:hypothetical protein